MSATASAAAPESNIGARLRSAGEIEPGRLPRLRLIAQQWAEAAGAALGELAASPVSVELAGVSSTRFGKHSPEVSSATLAALITSPAWPDPGFVLAEAGLIEILAEALFGGDSAGVVPHGRPLTPIDRSVVELALQSFDAGAQQAFLEVTDLAMAMQSLLECDIGDQLADALPGGGTRYLLVSFEVKVGSLKTQLRYAMPESFLGPHRRKLAAQPEAPAVLADEDWARDIQFGIGQADLSLRAILDERQVTLEEVADFAVGQTIMLGAGLRSLISVECEDRRLFRARVGRARDAYVVKIEERVNQTEEFIDDILSH